MYEYEYERAGITADFFVWDALSKSFLTIVRKNSPFKNHLALPGGFMNMDETLTECALRELKEETNLDACDLHGTKFVGMLDKVDRDPRGRTLSALFCADILPSAINKVKAADDAVDFRWCPINLVTQEVFAFDHKNAIWLSLRALEII